MGNAGAGAALADETAVLGDGGVVAGAGGEVAPLEQAARTALRKRNRATPPRRSGRGIEGLRKRMG
jgi:hypothetical protein